MRSSLSDLPHDGNASDAPSSNASEASEATASQQETTPALSPPKEMPTLSLGNLAWPLLLSLGVLGVVGYFTFDLSTFRTLVGQLNPWLLGAAGATVVGRVLFGGWRLHFLSRGSLGAGQSIRYQLAWDFFAYITPSTIGGGPFVAVFIGRTSRLPLGESTSIILFAMLLDQISFALTIPLLLVCAAYWPVFPASMGTVGTGSMVLFFVGFMGWVTLFGYSTLFRPQLIESLIDRMFRLPILRRFQTRARDVARDLRRRATLLRSEPPGFFFKGFLLTLVPWICRYLLAVFIIWSVYPAASQWIVLLRSVAMNIGALALPTPGGAGGAEGLYALFLGAPLIPQALVAPTLLAWRFLSYYIFLIAGSFIATRQVQSTLTTSSDDEAASRDETAK